jgi:hypothetical protein
MSLRIFASLDYVRPAYNGEGITGDSISVEKNETNSPSDPRQELHQAHEMVQLVGQPGTTYQWCEKLPRYFMSKFDSELKCGHTRKVFISTYDSSLPRFVAKIETAAMRDFKLDRALPHAEEIAYKICKLFHWTIVPKTKIVHQYAFFQEEPTKKNQKYIELMNCFKCDKYSLTFTFQAFVEGETLPDITEDKTPVPGLSSYQKAYLLGSALGKYDARGDNIILNPQSGELFEIDNEYIGEMGYESSGVLNRFKKSKNAEISPEILDDVLNIQPAQLTKIRDKYQVRDVNLILLWAEELKPANYSFQAADECWMTIMNNINYLQTRIRALREQKVKITIAKLGSLHQLSLFHLYSRIPEENLAYLKSATDFEGDDDQDGKAGQA